MRGGDLAIESTGDAIKSDKEDDTTLGFISIERGTFNLVSYGDALNAETDLLIGDGNFRITSGGGSNTTVSGDVSAKGMKAGSNVIIEGGQFVISSADDAIHSNSNLVIHNGDFQIATGDDGLHADETLGINGGVINISKSYEGQTAHPLIAIRKPVITETGVTGAENLKVHRFNVCVKATSPGLQFNCQSIFRR